MFRTFLQWLSPNRPIRDQVQAHMTFGKTSVGKTVRRTGVFLRKQLWLWPIIAVVLLSIAGFAVSSSINRTVMHSLSSELTTLLGVERAMLEKWFKVQESSAMTLANDAQVRETVRQLLMAFKNEGQTGTRSEADSGKESSIAQIQNEFRQELDASMTSHDFVGFVLADKQQRIIAAQTQELVGQIIPQYEAMFAKTFEGEATVSVPFESEAMLKDRNGRMRTGVPTMFVCAPVRDENLQIVAALAMRIRPEREFTEILQLGRLGETGETYAVDKHGVMVSNSRFDEHLILLGVLADQEGAASILKVQVRDPGGDLEEGYRPIIRRGEMPLTEICLRTTSGSSGVTMNRYRNYRGAMSVGAWTWLPKYHLGLITEIEAAEAFRPLTILNWAFYSLYALLVASAVAIFAFTLIVSRLQRDAQKAAIEAKQLGQYRLETRLGAGAMGIVYKGQHAMLRRPTAIKMLQVDKVNENTIARFEREVQITCKLNHPNTIAIYDYGRTPEGVFYYAMEFLDGIDLQTLVERYGPQPEGRVVHILRQICGSLFEAHSLGLVHRDIKPANIMLNHRGGEPDVVKVLDFGLVKALDGKQPSQEAGGLSGTPLYMSPESIQTPDAVDARSDIYAVGAVGYFLLTGKTVFQASSLSELCQQHITTVPEPPSQRSGITVSSALENALMSCLEKSRARRPQTARDLAIRIEASAAANGWKTDEAEAWWRRHERELSRSHDTNLTVDSEAPWASTRAGISATEGGESKTDANSSIKRRTLAAGFDQTMAHEEDS